MTKEQFIEHMLAVDNSKGMIELLKTENYPLMLREIILYAWINKTPENEHTEALREQAINLWKNEGYFIFN